MQRKRSVFSLSVILALLLAACGSGDGSAPVAMVDHEASGLTIERPEDWSTDSLHMFGISVVIASSKELKAETVMGGGDFAEAFRDAAGVLIMSVPQEMAGQGSDFGFSEDELKSLADDEPDVEVIRQGEITVSGEKGYEIVIKGTMQEFGSTAMAAHFAGIERASGRLAFKAFSSEQDIDKNLDIFQYILESLRFK